MVLQRC